MSEHDPHARFWWTGRTSEATKQYSTERMPGNCTHGLGCRISCALLTGTHAHPPTQPKVSATRDCMNAKTCKYTIICGLQQYNHHSDVMNNLPPNCFWGFEEHLSRSISSRSASRVWSFIMRHSACVPGSLYIFSLIPIYCQHSWCEVCFVPYKGYCG